MDFGPIKALTFDCYGTIVDWETGILSALSKTRQEFGVELGDAAVLAAFAAAETAQESAQPGAFYPDILAAVYNDLTADWCITPPDGADAVFGQSIGDWPVFADSAEALKYLGEHFVLGVLSNVDRGSFDRTQAQLGVEFDEVMTAEDIGSYKPDPRNFEFLLARMAERGIEPGQVLHVAQSLYHDHVPAKQFGLKTVFVDRRSDRAGNGAVPAPTEEVRPDLEVPDLATLAALHREFASAKGE